MKFKYTQRKKTPVSSDALIKDMQKTAKELGVEKLSQSLYSKYGKYNWSTIHRRFGTWNKALLEAGLRISNIVNYSDENLFENILNVWQKKGSQPTRKEIIFLVFNVEIVQQKTLP